jgi:hypothetical protein
MFSCFFRQGIDRCVKVVCLPAGAAGIEPPEPMRTDRQGRRRSGGFVTLPLCRRRSGVVTPVVVIGVVTPVVVMAGRSRNDSDHPTVTTH